MYHSKNEARVNDRTTHCQLVLHLFSSISLSMSFEKMRSKSVRFIDVMYEYECHMYILCGTYIFFFNFLVCVRSSLIGIGAERSRLGYSV